MIVYGYVKGYRYSGDGTMEIQVRIPNIHGAYKLTDYNGKKVRNYTKDEDLPWYRSLLLPHTPSDGEVVALCSTNEATHSWIVIGLTGGTYTAGSTL